MYRSNKKGSKTSQLGVAMVRRSQKNNKKATASNEELMTLSREGPPLSQPCQPDPSQPVTSQP